MSGMTFSHAIIQWQQQYGRHDLPWQKTRDPYRIWLAEIMLQQTQVTTVIPYYQRFLKNYPTLPQLAQASSDEVMSLWSGLGYYARARNLHLCAQIICNQYQGHFPRQASLIAQLPGIGRSTAAAIAAFAFGERGAILDGNVKRVFCRYFGVTGFPGIKQVEQELWVLAEKQLPQQQIEIYTQGLMDLGATLCTRIQPACTQCPVQAHCIAFQHQRIDQLPAPRPRQNQPQRYVAFLILHNNADVLVEKRPAKGIWGGLWSLPQIDLNISDFSAGITAITVQEKIIEHLTQDKITPQHVHSIQALPTFAHAFSHFKLHILPINICLINRPQQIPNHHYQWLTLSSIHKIGLPTPVHHLLKKFPLKEINPSS